MSNKSVPENVLKLIKVLRGVAKYEGEAPSDIRESAADFAESRLITAISDLLAAYQPGRVEKLADEMNNALTDFDTYHAALRSYTELWYQTGYDDALKQEIPPLLVTKRDAALDRLVAVTKNLPCLQPKQSSTLPDVGDAEVVERVARALALALFDSLGGIGDCPRGDWAEMSWKHHVEAARTAIAAMQMGRE